MTKEDKQIIDRAVKEEWRIGDRTRLKRLLEKNLKLYRENVELEQKLEQTEKDLADYQFNYPKIKELEKENAELKAKNKWYSEQVCNKECAEVWGQLTKAKEIILHLLACGNFNFKCEKVPIEKYVKQAEQFIKEIEK